MPLVDNNIYRLSFDNYNFDALLGLGLVTMDDRYYNFYDMMQDVGRIRAMIIEYVHEEKSRNLASIVDNN